MDVLLEQTIPPYRNHIWLLWSTAFLLPWLALFLAFPRHRKVMWRASIFTMPFGLSEPLFVPAYWNPPTLFSLAQRTGFDIESLIFSFGIGGVAAVLYNILTGRLPEPMPTQETYHQRHRYHRAALLAPVVSFPVLVFLPWNPIYPAIVSMALGALATVACRPDLTKNTFTGSALFAAYYSVFMVGLALTVPGYIARVWNLGALSGLLVHGIPVEELLFGAAFGAYWSSIYEHLTWRRLNGKVSRQGSAKMPMHS